MGRGIAVFVLAFLLLVSFGSCRHEPTDDARYIPRFHFTVGADWTGEPVGLVYDEGVYHLFYQYNPSGSMFGDIHWGHAVSRDLFRWQIEPVALSPDSLGYLGAGSVVVDRGNTSGLGDGGNAPFLAFYKYANEESGRDIFLAYSEDKGLSWSRYGKIALPDADRYTFRSPRVSWNHSLGAWLMTLSTGSSIRFYKSPDAKEWTFLSAFADPAERGTTWEGSDFFPLEASVGDTCVTKWVLSVTMDNVLAGSLPAMRYYVGDFDGVSFLPTQTKELWLDYGKDNRSGVICAGIPEASPVYLGWMNNWEYANLLPTSAWRGNMTLPRRLGLRAEGNHFLLASSIAEGLGVRQGDSCRVDAVELSDERCVKKEFPYPDGAFMIRLRFDNADNRAIWKARDYGIRLKTRSGKEVAIGYQNELSYYYINRDGLLGADAPEGFAGLMGAGYRSDDPVSEWCVVYDGNTMELFASGGRSVISALVYPDEAFSQMELFAESGSVTLLEASIIQLK